MKKQEFLAALREALGKLPDQEVRATLDFYSEAIDDRMEDGAMEEDAVSALGSVADIAAQVAAATPPIPKAVAKMKTPSRTANIVLAAILSPIWVPLALAFLACVACIYLSIWTIIIALWVCVAVLLLCAPTGIAGLVWCMAEGFPLTGVWLLGGGLVGSGLGLFALMGMKAVSNGLVQLTSSFARSVKGLFLKEKRAPSDQAGAAHTVGVNPQDPSTPPQPPVGCCLAAEGGATASVSNGPEEPATKTSRKALLVTATILVAAGAVLMLGVFSLVGGDMEKLSTDQHDWTRKTYETPADPSAALASIACSDDSESVYIEGYAGDTVRVEYWVHQQRDVEVRQDGDSLSIAGSTSDDPSGIRVFVGTSEDHSTRVLVPQEFTGSLRASSTAGYASVANVDSASEVDVDSENGFALASNLRAQTLRMESRNGFVQCDTVSIAEDLTVSSENGTVTLDSVLADNVSASSENGTISVVATTAQDTLSAALRNGDISLSGIDAFEIETNADGGTTRIALPGNIDDYAIFATAENGYVSAPAASNRGAARQVMAQSKNGELFVYCEGGDLEAPDIVYRGEAR